MMSPRRRRSSALRLVVFIVALLLCIWLLYRLFIGIGPAPPPRIERGAAPASVPPA
jgi:hypothetical protein